MEFLEAVTSALRALLQTLASNNISQVRLLFPQGWRCQKGDELRKLGEGEVWKGCSPNMQPVSPNMYRVLFLSVSVASVQPVCR